LEQLCIGVKSRHAFFDSLTDLDELIKRCYHKLRDQQGKNNAFFVELAFKIIAQQAAGMVLHVAMLTSNLDNIMPYGRYRDGYRGMCSVNGLNIFYG
jgi:hypothetical protein